MFVLMPDFEATAATCAPHVAASTLRAMATVESGMNPNAIGVVNGRLVRQPKNVLEAVSTVTALQQNGTKFSAGLIQIYVGNWSAYQLDRENVFDPCSNLRAAAGILTPVLSKGDRPRSRRAGLAARRDQLLLLEQFRDRLPARLCAEGCLGRNQIRRTRANARPQG